MEKLRLKRSSGMMASIALAMSDSVIGNQHPSAPAGKRPGTAKTPAIKRRRAKNKVARKARKANRK